jgi:hypothetical protein
VVVLFGVVVATGLTLYIIPVAYQIIARATDTPLATTRELARQLDQSPLAADADRYPSSSLAGREPSP